MARPRSGRSGPGQAGQQARRPDIGVLVKTLADGEAQTPERDVVGQVGVADRAEKIASNAFELPQPVGRHHAAVAAIVVRAPAEAFEGEGEVRLGFGERREDAAAGLDHLGADAVAADYRDPVLRHRGLPYLSEFTLRRSTLSIPFQGREGRPDNA